MTAPVDLPLRCSCGALRGVLRGMSPARGNRVVCYCRDCQAFAHFLDRDEILDAHDRAPPAAVARATRIVLAAWLRGDQRRSPFFGPVTRAPVATPRVLSAAERATVATRVAAQATDGHG